MATSRQIFILRHAKSGWDDPSLDDRDRPLAPRGRRAVEMMAEHLRVRHIHPGLVLCSPARRTRETLEGVAPTGERLIEPALYSASGADLLERLRIVPEDIESVMVVGHNPAMQTLTLRLAGAQPARDGSDLAAVQRKFPAGALASLSFEGKWTELGPGRARLTGFVRPKALMRSGETP
jgi:phosphohistidine phosphatase